MRRLVLEGKIEDFRNLAGGTSQIAIEKVKTFEILHVLRFDANESAAICRIEPVNPMDTVDDIYVGSEARVVVLETEKEGTYTCFVKVRPRNISRELIGTGIYFSGLGEIKDGRVRIGVLGESKQLNDFVEYVENAGVHLNVASIADSTFPMNYPLDGLTKRQKEVLSQAFALGYYDLPRRIDSEGLASKLGLKSSTLIEHRRKAENRLFKRLFEDYI